MVVVAGAVSKGSGGKAGFTLVQWFGSVVVGFQEHPQFLRSGHSRHLNCGAGAGAVGTLSCGAGAGAIGEASAWCRSRLVVWARACTSLLVSGSTVPWKVSEIIRTTSFMQPTMRSALEATGILIWGGGNHATVSVLRSFLVFQIHTR